MRNMGMLVAIALIVIPTVVSAETWTATVGPAREKSESGTASDSNGGALPRERCGKPQRPVVYTLELTNNTFTATSQYGKMFSIAVPADGVIKKTFRRAGRSGQMTFEMTGNVKSRELEITDVNSGCHYDLTPTSSLPPLR